MRGGPGRRGRAGRATPGGLRRPHGRRRDLARPAAARPGHRRRGRPSPAARLSRGGAGSPAEPAPGGGRPPRRHPLGPRRGDLPPGAGPARVTACWHRIHELNRDVIGDDPDLIQPGQRLRLPPPLTVHREESACPTTPRAGPAPHARLRAGGQRPGHPRARPASPAATRPPPRPADAPEAGAVRRHPDRPAPAARGRAVGAALRPGRGRDRRRRPAGLPAAALVHRATCTRTWSAARCWSPAPAGTGPGRAGCSRCARWWSACTPASCTAGVVEVSVHVRYGGRSRALAARFELLAGRWQCSAPRVRLSRAERAAAGALTRSSAGDCGERSRAAPPMPGQRRTVRPMPRSPPGTCRQLPGSAPGECPQRARLSR